MTTEAARAIEAILMVAQEPIDPHLLAQLLEISPARVEELCTELQAGYEDQQRGFVLARVAGGYRFQSHGDLAPYVERFVLEGQSAKLSAAALETLAIVAYKQPLSRAQVASIRGVNVDGVMRTLQQRGYVVEVGKDSGPGQATLFGTSREFLERMGLDRIEDLPPIAALFPSTEVMEALERGLRADAVAEPADPTVESAENAETDEVPAGGSGQAPPASDEPAAPPRDAEGEGEPSAEPEGDDAEVDVEVEVEVEAAGGSDAAAPIAELGTAVGESPQPEAQAPVEPDDAVPPVDGEVEVEVDPDADIDGSAPVAEPAGEPEAGAEPLGLDDDLDGPVPPLEEPSWARRDEPAEQPVDDGPDDPASGS